MRNEYREMAFEFYKSHQDSQYTFEEMMKQIKESLKQEVRELIGNALEI